MIWGGGGADCFIVIDTGYNGGEARIYRRFQRYVEYFGDSTLRVIWRKPAGWDLRFGNHQVLNSDASAALIICVNGAFIPALATLIRDITDLLRAVHIIGNLGAQVCFGSDRSDVCQVEWQMMTINERNRWVAHRAPHVVITINRASISGNCVNRKLTLC